MMLLRLSEGLAGPPGELDARPTCSPRRSNRSTPSGEDTDAQVRAPSAGLGSRTAHGAVATAPPLIDQRTRDASQNRHAARELRGDPCATRGKFRESPRK